MKNKQEDEKLIGLIVGGISNEFSKNIIKGVSGAISKNSGVRLAVLPGELMVKDFLGQGVLQHNAMFNSVYNLGSICKMDGLIIAMGSIGWLLDEEQTRSFLKQFDGIPTVLIASDYEDYTTVNYNNKMGISQAIDCLVGTYGLDRIGMIGGYDENIDAIRRKKIFVQCIEEKGIKFKDEMYVASDMSENSEKAAEKLLRDNPGLQAVFCVNDATATGLYNVLKRDGIRIGKDIMVFGFDNTHKSSIMSPPLSSIGPDDMSLGLKSYELLMAKINGEKVESAEVPTRLHGRESMEYEKYDYTRADLDKMDERIINRMFDDCFYRYASESAGKESVNLRRLFYEIIIRIFSGLKKRYIGVDEFEEISGLIDILFSNGAMEFTDVGTFLRCVYRLQTGINKQQIGRENVFVNRLFLRMKDDALRSVSDISTKDRYNSLMFRSQLRRFLIRGMGYHEEKKKMLREFMESVEMLNIQNAAFYLFEKPLAKDDIESFNYPDKIQLKSVIKSGEVYIIPEEKQERPLSDIYIQREIRTYNIQFVTFPIFYEKVFYGFLLCELTDELYDQGELIANIIGTMIRILRES
ncbi:MAG: substrate-binding domain-containing protein [Eubacterium sp.]|nr:substrate-binding domain-containing protein [Eubacterium sp.]